MVGAAALAVSAYTTFQEHRHAQAEVWPRITMMTDDSDNAFQVTVENKGTGPAMIRDFTKRIDGRVVTTWSAWIDTVVGRHVPIGDYGKRDLVGEILSPGESIKMFVTHDPEIRRAFDLSPHKEVTSICYCSVFEDCFLAGGARSRGGPVRVDACPDPGPNSWVGFGPGEWAELDALMNGRRVDAGDAAGAGEPASRDQ